MTVSLALWSVCVQPGEDGVAAVSPPADIRVTNIALSDQLADETGRTTVKLNYIVPNAEDSEDEEEDEDEEDENPPRMETTVLCSLTPGKIEQATVDVVLTQDDEFLIEVVGKNSVYLSGNYIDQTPDDVPYNDDSEPESDEEDFDLSMDPEEMDGISDDADRFEEIQEESAPVASKKRTREADAETPEKLTKAQKKKLKAESGAAVPSGSDAKVDAAKTNGDAVKDKKDKKEKEKEKKPETRTLESGIQITDVTVGKGPQAKKGNTVNMRYIGKLANGKVFDSNTKGAPFSFTLGRGEVIKGWDIGVAGMQAGGERKLVVPPKLGYGAKKSGPIPPNSTLTFEVKMVDIK